MLYVDRFSQTVRCYCRGHLRYGGRCREHDELPGRLASGRFVCGWQRSDGAPHCQNPVHIQGRRCHIHAPSQVQEREQRQRAELKESLFKKLKQQRRVERDLGWIRAELARLGERVDAETEAAE
jgi:hypothetical protein